MNRAKYGFQVFLLISQFFLSLVFADSNPPVVKSGSGVVANVEVSRLVIDVTAEDEAGNPLPHLKPEQFRLEIDGTEWQIESVDSFCPCPVEEQDRNVPQQENRDVLGTNVQIPSETRKFVLFFDMTQLGTVGQNYAKLKAEWWIKRIFPHNSFAKIWYFTGRIIESCPWTSDRDQLIAGIHQAFSDPQGTSIDARALQFRFDECNACQNGSNFRDNPMAQMLKHIGSSVPLDLCFRECTIPAIEEVRRGEHSLTALKLVLWSLSGIPGRKQLIYFNQTAGLFPGKDFGVADEFQVGDLLGIAEQVGADALQARVGIFPGFASQLTMTISDFAGTSREHSIKPPGVGCDCFYRLAIIPPAPEEERQHQFKVIAAGRELISNGRLGTPTKRERWNRLVYAALSASQEGCGLITGSGVFPKRADRKNWTVEVGVLVNLAALDWLPKEQRQEASWAVGALLSRNGGAKTWTLEQFTGGRLPETKGPTGEIAAWHRTEMEIPPGDYELRSFAGDTSGQRACGAETKLFLPDPRKLGIVGPFVRTGDKKILLLPFRIQGSSEPNQQGGTVGKTEVPIPILGFAPGDEIVLLTFLCPGKNGLPGVVQRRLTEGDQELFMTERPPVSEGSCFKVEDRYKLRPELAGSTLLYYEVTWTPDPAAPPLKVGVDIPLRLSSPTENPTGPQPWIKSVPVPAR